MKNLKIRTQILILAGILLFLMAIIGTISIKAISNIKHLSDIKAHSEKIKQLTLEIRKNEKDFLMRETTNSSYFSSGDSKYINNISTLIREINEHCRYLENEKKLQQTNIDHSVSSLVQHISLYQTTFNEIAHNTFEKGYKDFGLVGDLRKSIHYIEEQIEPLNLNADFEVIMLTLRRNEKDYLIRKDLKYKQSFTNNIQKIKSFIENSPQLSNSNKVSLNKKIDDYQEAFFTVIEKDVEIGLSEKEGHLGELRAEVHEVEPLVEQISLSISQVIDESIQRNFVILVVFIIIGIILGIFISLLINNGIMLALGGEVQDVAEIAQRVSDGDLTIKFSDNSRGIIKSLQDMVIKLRQLVDEIQNGANQITVASQEVSSGSQQLSQGAMEQAASIEEVSSTMEEMTSNILQSTDNVIETDRISRIAFEGVNKVNETSNKSMSSIQDIASKITVINDIAFQTNILALNAAVEAARAGEHGKGFAVVASEVRKLAEKSKDAAKEIIEYAERSVEATTEASARLNEIIPEIQKTSGLIEEITASSKEQAHGSDQVNAAIQQLNSVTQQNSSASEELASNAEEMSSQAEELKSLINYFKVK